ncbi:MAG TPA: VWA domain-containing protein [Thermoanaerobaculia bacterium]|jgi:VWFA-related protein|nr:VWA domain-containing protein [Thermoanaerobaculia bacterium]
MRYRVLPLLLLLSFSLAAQPITETLTVEVIDVPVFVARGNNAVEGLARDSFELYVNGKRTPIEYFETVTAAEAAPTLRERRLFLLLFDVAFSHPLVLPRAQRAAEQLIAHASPADYFAVATYSNRRGVWFAAPFTRDREALTRALGSLNNSRSGDPLAIVLTASERADGGNFASDIASEALRDMQLAGARRAAEDQMLGLAELSERFGALEGQKHILFLSEGWDGRPAEGMSFDIHLIDELVAMHHRFHASSVFLHALDLEGVGGSLMANDGLHEMTLGTGGKLVQSRNDLGAALSDLSDSLDRGYRIGFRPVNAKSGYNTIEVKVRNAGRVQVNHRRGFSTDAEPADVDDGLYLADVVLNDVPQTGTAATLTLRDGKLSARIPMREVAAQAREAELLVYAFSADGAALMYHREVIQVTMDAEKVVEIAMPEGTKVAKALLRVDGELGFSRVTF